MSVLSCKQNRKEKAKKKKRKFNKLSHGKMGIDGDPFSQNTDISTKVKVAKNKINKQRINFLT